MSRSRRQYRLPMVAVALALAVLVAAAWQRRASPPAASARPARAEDLASLHADLAQRLAAIEAVSALPEAAKSAGRPWIALGPHLQGGRARAFAVDHNDPRRLLLGGATGGVWLSADRGIHWRRAQTPDELVGVTSLAQDPRPAQGHRWYLSGGEGRFFVTNPSFGFFRSEDGGETWQVVSTSAEFPHLEYTLRVAVSGRGHVFVASQRAGVYRSVDFGTGWDPISGRHRFSDVGAHGDTVLTIGTDLATDTEGGQPELWLSTDGGESFESLAPPPGGRLADRCVLQVATADVAWVLCDHSNHLRYGRLLRFDIPTRTWSDRTEGLRLEASPEWGEEARAFGDTYEGYTLALAVSPQDSDLVLVGGTQLARSFDGFSTRGTRDDVVGGNIHTRYDQEIRLHHADQHLMVFDPLNPGGVYSVNDGGLYYTTDIAGPIIEWNRQVPWRSLNRGISTAQIYDVSMVVTEQAERFVIGTQDNGTLLLNRDRATGQLGEVWLLSGDGGDSHLFRDGGRAIISTQLGSVHGLDLTTSSMLTTHPAARPDDTFPFITRLGVEPSREERLFVTGSRGLWTTDELPDTDSAFPPMPTWRLVAWPDSQAGYAETFAFGRGAVSPPLVVARGLELMMVRHAAEPDALEHLSRVPAQGQITALAFFPDSDTELVVGTSGPYSRGVFHSIDGGVTWREVTGDLPGAVRPTALAIVEHGGNPEILLGTNAGLLGTSALAGGETAWTRLSVAEVGHAVVSDIDVSDDGSVAVATYGDGLFARLGQIAEEQPAWSGIRFDPNYAGEGVSIWQSTAALVHVQYYSFDESGSPRWDWIDLAPSPLGLRSTSAGWLSFAQDGNEVSTVPRPWPSFATLHTDQASRIRSCGQRRPPVARPPSADYLSFWFAIDAEERVRCLQRLIPETDRGPREGLWYAGDDDAGWGLAIREGQAVLFGVLYLYDREGQPTWLTFQGASDQVRFTVDETVLPCPSCEPSTYPVGTINLSPAESGLALELALENDRVSWNRQTPLIRLAQ